MSMLTHIEARRRILAMVPACKGWKRYEDVAQPGKAPPWIVLKFIENQRLTTESLAVTTKLATLEIRVVGDTADGIGVRLTTESLAVTTKLATLEIRVVGDTADGIGVICDKMCDALQGAWPGRPFGRISLDVDSGVYPSELVSTVTSLPFLMRVLRFRVSWAAC